MVSCVKCGRESEFLYCNTCHEKARTKSMERFFPVIDTIEENLRNL